MEPHFWREPGDKSAMTSKAVGDDRNQQSIAPEFGPPTHIRPPADGGVSVGQRFRNKATRELRGFARTTMGWCEAEIAMAVAAWPFQQLQRLPQLLAEAAFPLANFGFPARHD